MLESIGTLNSYGLEVTSGIILGLDTDTADTEQRLIDFIERVEHPDADDQPAAGAAEDAAVGSAEARRPARRGHGRESNVQFLRPYDEVVATWRRSIAHAYDPEQLFERFRHQVDATYVNRKDVAREGQAHLEQPARRRRAGVARQSSHVGIKSDYRRAFWRAAWYALKHGQIDGALGMAFIAHHLIKFTREALRGDQNASYYSAKKRVQPMAVAKPPGEQVAA